MIDSDNVEYLENKKKFVSPNKDYESSEIRVINSGNKEKKNLNYVLMILILIISIIIGTIMYKM